jgi:hypothetical protein
MEKAVRSLEKFQAELEEYRKKNQYNVLVPTVTIQEISPFHKPVLEIVRINPDPKAGGEVYEVVFGSGSFSLRAVALNKIAFAAGIIWNAKNSGRTDDGSNPDIVSYRAEAAVRKEDGTYMVRNAEYMLDLKVVEQEIRDSYEQKSQALMKEKKAKNEKWTEEDRKNYVEKSVKRDMLQKRKFRLQLTSTGAMDRVIRLILGLKSTYKREELEKPFVVPKIAFSPDVSDPKVRDLLLRQGLDATNVLFGPSPERSMIDYQPEHRVIDVTPADAGVDAESSEAEEKTPEKVHELVQEKPFEEMEAKGQSECLKKLIEKKGYDKSKLKKPIESFTDVERVKFHERLKGMADVEELPFE